MRTATITAIFSGVIIIALLVYVYYRYSVVEKPMIVYSEDWDKLF